MILHGSRLSIGEDHSGSIEQLTFPVANLGGMDLKPGGQFAGGFDALECLESHAGFKLWRMLFTLSHKTNPL